MFCRKATSLGTQSPGVQTWNSLKMLIFSKILRLLMHRTLRFASGLRPRASDTEGAKNGAAHATAYVAFLAIRSEEAAERA